MRCKLPGPFIILFYFILFYFILTLFSAHLFLHSTNMYELRDVPGAGQGTRYGWEKKTIRWNSGNNKVLKGMALS